MAGFAKVSGRVTIVVYINSLQDCVLSYYEPICDTLLAFSQVENAAIASANQQSVIAQDQSAEAKDDSKTANILAILSIITSGLTGLFVPLFIHRQQLKHRVVPSPQP